MPGVSWRAPFSRKPAARNALTVVRRCRRGNALARYPQSSVKRTGAGCKPDHLEQEIDIGALGCRLGVEPAVIATPAVKKPPVAPF
jgi:hypothetical protein